MTASNENLVAGTRQGRFWEDLYHYHRLAVITVWLLPLRERRVDIVILLAQQHADWNISRAAAQLGLGGSTNPRAHRATRVAPHVIESPTLARGP